MHTGLSVAEAAEQSGFVNQFHFSRKFKQGLGYSPLEWRADLEVGRLRRLTGMLSVPSVSIEVVSGCPGL